MSSLVLSMVLRYFSTPSSRLTTRPARSWIFCSLSAKDSRIFSCGQKRPTWLYFRRSLIAVHLSVRLLSSSCSESFNCWFSLSCTSVTVWMLRFRIFSWINLTQKAATFASCARLPGLCDRTRREFLCFREACPRPTARQEPSFPEERPSPLFPAGCGRW